MVREIIRDTVGSYGHVKAWVTRLEGLEFHSQHNSELRVLDTSNWPFRAYSVTHNSETHQVHIWIRVHSGYSFPCVWLFVAPAEGNTLAEGTLTFGPNPYISVAVVWNGAWRFPRFQARLVGDAANVTRRLREEVQRVLRSCGLKKVAEKFLLDETMRMFALARGDIGKNLRVPKYPMRLWKGGRKEGETIFEFVQSVYGRYRAAGMQMSDLLRLDKPAYQKLANECYLKGLDPRNFMGSNRVRLREVQSLALAVSHRDVREAALDPTPKKKLRAKIYKAKNMARLRKIRQNARPQKSGRD